jgi:hypothetical protein
MKDDNILRVISSLFFILKKQFQRLQKIRKLAKLETKLSWRASIIIFILFIILWSLITSTWIFIIFTLFFFLLLNQFNIFSIGIIIFLINFALIAVVVYGIFMMQKNLFFQTTRKHILNFNVMDGISNDK